MTYGAAGMTWAEGDTWSVELDLPPGTYEFKLVVVREDGTSGDWESGANRELTVQHTSLPVFPTVSSPMSVFQALGFGLLHMCWVKK